MKLPVTGRQPGFALCAVLLATAAALPFANAQEVTGTLGSPSATTTISGEQLPPPAPAFGGVIKKTAPESKPWWPPRVVPPKGAPNILLIMTDDQGYGVSGTFGGVIPTPAMDRIAKAGLRYTQFHSTALCSPTRAALITGRNHHSVGLRRDRRDVHRLPRLRFRHQPGQGDHRDNPAGQRLCHFMVWQESQHAHLSIQRVGAVRSMAVGDGLSVFLRLHGRRDRPMDALSVPRPHADLSMDRSRRITTSSPTWRMKPSSTWAT